MHRRFVAVHCPVQHVDMRTVAFLELLLKRREDVQQLLRRCADALFAELEDGFFRAGALVTANLLHGSVALRVAALGVARTLPGDIIGIMPLVKDSLDLLEGRNVGAPFACAHSVQPVPIDILLCFRGVNVFGMGHVKVAVVVLGGEHAVLSGTTVVPGCSDFARIVPPCLRAAGAQRPVPSDCGRDYPLQSDAQHHFYRSARLPVGQRFHLWTLTRALRLWTPAGLPPAECSCPLVRI